MATDDTSFEAGFAELEQVVARLQEGGLTLEESLALFERGMVLTRQCSEQLERAELRLRQLLGDGSTEEIAPAPDEAEL